MGDKPYIHLRWVAQIESPTGTANLSISGCNFKKGVTSIARETCCKGVKLGSLGVSLVPWILPWRQRAIELGFWCTCFCLKKIINFIAVVSTSKMLNADREWSKASLCLLVNLSMRKRVNGIRWNNFPWENNHLVNMFTLIGMPKELEQKVK